MTEEAQRWLDDYAATVEFVGLAPDMEDLRRVLWIMSLKLAGAQQCPVKNTSPKIQN